MDTASGGGISKARAIESPTGLMLQCLSATGDVLLQFPIPRPLASA